jgi:hypothetical protein
MTVPSRILIALAFALFLLRGAFACEPAQPVAPAASHVAVRAASREAARQRPRAPHCAGIVRAPLVPPPIV